MTIAQKENRLINGKKIEEPDMTLHTSEYLKFDKMLEIHWKKKTVSSTNAVGQTWMNDNLSKNENKSIIIILPKT